MGNFLRFENFSVNLWSLQNRILVAWPSSWLLVLRATARLFPMMHTYYIHIIWPPGNIYKWTWLRLRIGGTCKRILIDYGHDSIVSFSRLCFYLFTNFLSERISHFFIWLIESLRLFFLNKCFISFRFLKHLPLAAIRTRYFAPNYSLFRVVFLFWKVVLILYFIRGLLLLCLFLRVYFMVSVLEIDVKSSI